MQEAEQIQTTLVGVFASIQDGTQQTVDTFGQHTTPPGATQQVAQVIAAADTLTVTLRWTAPAEAVTYTLRYNDAFISESSWGGAVPIAVPFSATPGGPEWLTAPVSHNGGTVYFALKSQNAGGDWSDLSNNAFWPFWDVLLPVVLKGAP